MIRELASFFVSMVIVALVVFGWMNYSHSLRLRRVRREYAALKNATLNDIFASIDDAGAKSRSCSVLVATPFEPSNVVPPDVAASHFGGIPYAEVNDTWPTPANSHAAEFLIQIALDESFPQPWPGRLIVIFVGHDSDPIVRCYSAPSSQSFVSIASGRQSLNAWKLHPVRIPKQPTPEVSEEDSNEVYTGLLDYDPVVLLDSVTGLREMLNPLTGRPADLLAAVLAPSHCGYGFELSDIVQLGGQPVWLEEEIDQIECRECGHAMRFLFQFGDLNGAEALGASGVCYVYGCDQHPQHLEAVIQNTNHD